MNQYLPVNSKNYDEIKFSLKPFIAKLNPTHFVTMHVIQGCSFTGPDGQKVWARGDDAMYDTAYRSFVRALSKQVLGSYWKAHKRAIGNIGVIEGGCGLTRNHVHMLLTKPEGMSDQNFRMQICKTVDGNRWIARGEGALDIKTLATKSDQINATMYMFKFGLDRALIA